MAPAFDGDRSHRESVRVRRGECQVSGLDLPQNARQHLAALVTRSASNGLGEGDREGATIDFDAHGALFFLALFERQGRVVIWGKGFDAELTAPGADLELAVAGRETYLAGRQAPRHLTEQPPRHDRLPRLVHGRSERGFHRQLEIGRGHADLVLLGGFDPEAR